MSDRPDVQANTDMDSEVPVYRVKFKQKDDTSKRCKLKGWYNLMVKDLGLCLYDDANTIVLKWPFQFIRRFMKNPDNFIVEAGRSCSCGEGVFTMQTKEGLAIFTSMVDKINTIANSCSPPLSPESSRGSVSTLGSVCEESRSIPNYSSTPEDANPYTEPFEIPEDDWPEGRAPLSPQSPPACLQPGASSDNQSSPTQPVRQKSEYMNHAGNLGSREHYMTMQNRHIDPEAPIQHYENMPPVRVPSVKERTSLRTSGVKFKRPDSVQQYESMQPVSNDDSVPVEHSGEEHVQSGNLVLTDVDLALNHYELMHPMAGLGVREEQPPSLGQSDSAAPLNLTDPAQDAPINRMQSNSQSKTVKQKTEPPCHIDRPDTLHYDTVDPALVRPVSDCRTSAVHHYDEPFTGNGPPEPHYDTVGPTGGTDKSSTLPVRHYANMKLSNAPVQHYLTMQTTPSEK